MSKTILLAGGSGFIGGKLQTKLSLAGHDVFTVSRTKQNPKTITWTEIKENGLPPCDAIINLSGANIIEKRWTDARKTELYSSRIGTNELLINKVIDSKIKLQHFISASAVGVYPPKNLQEVQDENTPLPPNTNELPFPQKLCQDWEQTVWSAKEQFAQHDHLVDCKLNIVRIGLVLGKEGGILKEILPVHKLGLGGTMGSGNQPYQWIHADDCTSIFEKLVSPSNQTKENSVEILNAVAPGYVNQRVFARTLSSVLHRPSFFWVPSFVVRLLFQDRAQLLLDGPWVSPTNTLRVLNDFHFQYSDLEPALLHLLK